MRKPSRFPAGRLGPIFAQICHMSGPRKRDIDVQSVPRPIDSTGTLPQRGWPNRATGLILVFKQACAASNRNVREPTEVSPKRSYSQVMIRKFRYLYLGVAVLGAVIVAAIAYEVGKGISTTFTSTGSIRIGLASEGGVSDPDVTAANDLASQYAQLVSSAAVQHKTAQRLGVSSSELNGSLSGSTLAAQNILVITASAGTAAQSRARATAATSVMQTYLETLEATVSQRYLTRIGDGLAKLGATTGRGRPPGTTAALVQAKAQALASGARDAAANTPVFQIVSEDAVATQTQPKPKLYALIALVLGLIVFGRLAFWGDRATSARETP